MASLEDIIRRPPRPLAARRRGSGRPAGASDTMEAVDTSDNDAAASAHPEAKDAGAS
jgi:hypothetical protein